MYVCMYVCMSHERAAFPAFQKLTSEQHFLLSKNTFKSVELFLFLFCLVRIETKRKTIFRNICKVIIFTGQRYNTITINS